MTAQRKLKLDRQADPTAGEPDMPAVEARAEGFQAVRDAHRGEIAQDYVELVQELIEQMGEARPVDIAERMGVRQPTVAKNLARLQREGLIRRERYRSVFLTESGLALAEKCRERHRIVVAFLMSLGLAAIVYRAERRFAMIEPDSLLMVVVYVLGIWLLYGRVAGE